MKSWTGRWPKIRNRGDQKEHHEYMTGTFPVMSGPIRPSSPQLRNYRPGTEITGTTSNVPFNEFPVTHNTKRADQGHGVIDCSPLKPLIAGTANQRRKQRVASRRFRRQPATLVRAPRGDAGG